MKQVFGQYFKEGSEIVQYLAAFAATLNIVTSGMHYGWPSPSLPILEDLNSTQSSVHLTSSEASWVAVMPLIGVIIGSITGGLTVDKIGRRSMVIYSSVPYIAAWFMVAFSKSMMVFCISRFIAGIADGCSFTAVPIYIGEFASPKIRGFLGSGVSVAFMLGTLLINVFGQFLSISTTGLISVIFPLMCMFTIIWMPKSPYWLLMKNKPEEAKRSLQIFRGLSDVEIEFTRLSDAVNAEQQSTKNGKFFDLFKVKSNRNALLIMMLLRGAQQLSGITAITFYTGHIFKQAGDIVSPKVATLIFFTIQFVLSFFSSSIVDLTGRRILLIISCIGSSICLIVEGVYFTLQFYKYDVSSFSYVPVTFLIIYVVVFSLGLQTIPVLMLGELFPPSIKAFALCWACMYFALLASIVSKFFQLIKDNFGMYIPFYAFAFSCILGLVLIVIFVPETKGKSLEDIQAYLKGDVSESKEDLKKDNEKCH